MALVEAFMDDGVDEGRTWRETRACAKWLRRSELKGPLAVLTMKQHPLVVMVVVLVCDLLLAMGVTFPQLLVHHLLDLQESD